MPFTRPCINNGYLEGQLDGISNLPDLIEFNATHNAELTFGLQSQANGLPPLKITYAQLQTAVVHASSWLLMSDCTTARTSHGKSPRPVAILLSSDIGIFIYMAALIRLGVPVCVQFPSSMSAVH